MKLFFIQVVFSFVCGVPENMKTYLESLGIVVEGNVITVEEDFPSDSSTDSDSEKYTVILKCDENSNPSDEKM